MRTLFVIVCMALVFAAPLRGQESIAAARDLYAAANYDDALVVLSKLDVSGIQVSDRLAVNQYRALCLLALGRANEAERAIEAVVSTDPLYRPAESEASPRLRTAFAAVRQRILPELVQQQYAYAKAAYDREEFAVAAASFERLLTVLNDPDLSAIAGRPPLSDLRTLAIGFRDLSKKAAEPPPAPPAPEATPVVVPPPAPVLKSVYGPGDADVVAPVTLRQELPSFPRELVAARPGVLEVLIDETGGVESATMRSGINPRYDSMVVNAAKGWRYEPAMVGGVAVKYRKLINIAVKPGS